MAKLDFANAKADIAQIVEIVKTVPEPLQERCFELLFETVFHGSRNRHEGPVEKVSEGRDEPQEKPTPPLVQEKKLPPNVLVLMRRHGISSDQLGKIFMLEHEPILP